MPSTRQWNSAADRSPSADRLPGGGGSRKLRGAGLRCAFCDAVGHRQTQMSRSDIHAPRFDVYRAASWQVREIFAEYTPLIEPLSLDKV